MAGGIILFPAVVLEEGYGWGERGQGGTGAAGWEDDGDGGWCWAFRQMLCWGSGILGLSKASVALSPTEPSVAPCGPSWQGLPRSLLGLGPPRSPAALARTLPT